MAVMNNATLIRRELITHIIKLLIQDRLEDDIDRIPILMRPRRGDSFRCCVAKDRAVLKYQIMALLGFNVQDETDELMPLSEYARIAKARRTLTDVVLTVVDEACSSCHKATYHVTNMCRGCVARPCMFNCPKKAISFVGGQAHIDDETCVSCGLCQSVCPYHAIIFSPIPCEQSCPVGAIYRNEQGIEQIDEEKCISCGKCKVACPFGAVMEKSHLVEIFERKREGKELVAIVAPAIAAQFNTELGRVLHSFKLLGFDHVYEAAQGADITTATETAELVERLAGGAKFMTTSCCPGYTSLVKRHVPELQEFVSHTLSPLGYTSEIARREHPDAILVFVSPCSAKRYEVFHNPNMDYMLTFEEYGSWLVAAGIDVNDVLPELGKDFIQPDSRGYAASAGVFNAVKHHAGDFAISELIINGIDKDQVKALRRLPKKCDANFVEVMMCEGGCIGGPNTIANPRVALRQLKKANDAMWAELTAQRGQEQASS